MSINRSAEKRERQNRKRRLRNRSTKSTMKTAIRKFNEAVASGDVESAGATLATSLKLIDSTASKGVIHKNTANRKKSRLQLRFNKMEQANVAQA
ncbi:MAG: 30S ribosomal protein S20 [Spirochaetes bacterium ADurb.Bin315]|nr:30S ribosomal protein S20 [Spirochaetota bacterium]OQA41501.1 MAG: 30S ribosomal protein S20 [Spirochaetes bacterium ADurb.Bin315]HOE88710.1 30S ribosomal protein S20 [Sphaerochaeta sp.]HOR79443.1 30S ribosomal protein S20 [Sphaerochaeta sp.]HPK63900.1 30S ribosomal protein S20 [Sphaerochaeta sp.]